MATTTTNTKKKKKKAKKEGSSSFDQVASDLTRGGELASRFGPDLSGPGFQHLANPFDSAERGAFGNSLYGMAGIDPVTGAFNGSYGGQFAGDIKDTLNRMKLGLEGYAAPELQAMREQASRGIDSQYATSLAGLAGAQSKAGVRGASALAQRNNLDRSRLGEQQTLEQDLFVRNADEKQNRLEKYGDYINTQTTGQQNALGSYGRFLDLKSQAQGATDRDNQGLDQLVATMKSELAGKYGGAIEADRSKKWTQKFMEAHPDSYQGGGGGSSSSSTGPSVDADRINEALAAIEKQKKESQVGAVVPPNGTSAGRFFY